MISQLKEQALARPAVASTTTEKLEQTKQQSADLQSLSDKIESLRLENDSLRRAKLEVGPRAFPLMSLEARVLMNLSALSLKLTSRS